MDIVKNERFDGERALYRSRGLTVAGCVFAGPADGESALKESEDVTARDCVFQLRYPLWHNRRLHMERCELTEGCRAALWYTEGADIAASKLHGVKALRECEDVAIRDCDIRSAEFGWSLRGLSMDNVRAEGEYFLLRGEDVTARGLTFRGKYAFQYVKHAVFDHCVFDTKDAFWHGEDITVRDSVLRGEYLGWYSSGLTLERCRIIGTQPLCWCRGLRLIQCDMTGCDLAFEHSEAEATLTAPIASVKNPAAGLICAPAVGNMILDDPAARGEILVGGSYAERGTV